MAKKLAREMIQQVRPESMVRAFAIKSAALQNPTMFEPVPDYGPAFEHNGKSYSFSKTNKHVRADFALLRAFDLAGPEYSMAVMMRLSSTIRCIMSEAQKFRDAGLIRGEGEPIDVSEAVLSASATVECCGRTGIDVAKLISAAKAIHDAEDSDAAA